MGLTAPADSPPRLRTCPRCKTPRATVDVDEREAFGLPAEVCTCDLQQCIARLNTDGFVPVDDAAISVARKANWPRRFGPVRTIAVKGEGGRGTVGHLVVKPFVSPVIPAALRVVAASDQFGAGMATDAQAELVATMLRRITDPALRDAMNAAVRIAGDSAVDDLLFGPMRDAAGEDPDTREDNAARIARVTANLFRRGKP